ncbi:MAG TPA: type IV pilus assembly protein PilM [Planctomycetota bacterium]|nr:type IV pilus assembly protein PilM [Planctomycetota bacterium]
MARGVWGIDVSKYSIKVARLEGSGRGVTLTHVGVFPYEESGSGEPGGVDRQIRTALAQVKAQYKIAGEPVVLSLPSHSILNRLVKLPPVEDAKIPEVVKYEAQSQIPFPMDEVLWDYQYVDRDYVPGEEKEVILFAIKRDIVEQFLANIADLGLNVEAVQFAPVALFNFLVRDQELSGPTVALDMGAENTDLIVIDGTKFWVRNLPITGNDLTKALQKAFNLPFEEAEKLKLRAAQSQQAQKIFNAVQPVLRDLVNEINRSTGYYKSISKTSKFEKILLLGNATKTLNFQKFISQSLQLPAVRLQKLNTVQVGGQVDPGDLQEHLAGLGTALGLALQGLGETVNRINLLPPAHRRRKELRRKQPYVVAAVAALYALVGLMGWRQYSERDELQKAVTRAKQAKQEAAAQKAEYEQAIQVDEIRAQLEPLVRISTERDLILKVMDLLNPNLPDNGNWELPADQKLWVVDWKFEEKERPKAAEGGAAPAVFNPATAGQPKPYPTQKILVTTLEVVIAKRSTDAQGRDFVIRTLLNYDPLRKAPVKPAQPCAVKNPYWELAEGQGPVGFWQVELDHPITEALAWPVPRGFQKRLENEPERKNYWRYRVTLQIPVGEEQRKALAAADKGGEKK